VLFPAAGGPRAWLKAKLLRQLPSRDVEGEGKENSVPKSDADKESAAVVIQSCK
jgi:hypothetical protein